MEEVGVAVAHTVIKLSIDYCFYNERVLKIELSSALEDHTSRNQQDLEFRTEILLND